MISGIDLKATVDFVCKGDKDNPTIWKLGVLPSREMAKVITASTQGDNMQQMINLVRLGLKGWENFTIPFETSDNGIPTTIIDIIPINIIVELGTELLKINKLSADESKN